MQKRNYLIPKTKTTRYSNNSDSDNDDIYQTMFNEYNLKLLIKSLPVVPTEDAQQQHRNDEFERIQKIFNKLTNNKYV